MTSDCEPIFDEWVQHCQSCIPCYCFNSLQRILNNDAAACAEGKVIWERLRALVVKK
jgi:hypothetical protein